MNLSEECQKPCNRPWTSIGRHLFPLVLKWNFLIEILACYQNFNWTVLLVSGLLDYFIPDNQQRRGTCPNRLDSQGNHWDSGTWLHRETVPRQGWLKTHRQPSCLKTKMWRQHSGRCALLWNMRWVVRASVTMIKTWEHKVKSLNQHFREFLKGMFHRKIR